MTSATTEKIYALDLSIEEWTGLLTEIEDKPFRAAQITQWLWQKHVYSTDEMTNLSKALRDKLEERVDFQLPDLMKEQRSSDATRKYLWRLRDGQTVESVLMKHGDRLTACVSTQVGCPLQCTFCATGLSGYVRNLSAGEIAAQFLAMERAAGRDIGNVVYMGMGEPFLNTENVLKSVRMLSNAKMRNLGIRHFTISTSGVLPGIIALAKSGLGVRLAISLHAADDDLRGQLMPVNLKYPVSELRSTMEEYQRITGDRLTIEYALFGGVNDSVDCARALVRYLKGLHVFINLIPFNAVDDRFERPSAQDVLKFRKVLETAGFEVELRHEYGADIDAACGQLRRKTVTGEPCRLDQKPGFKPSVTQAEPEPRKTPNPKREAGKETRRDSKGKIKTETTKPRSGKTQEDKRRRLEPTRGFTEERKYDARRQRPTESDGKFSKSGEKRGKIDEPQKERYRSEKTENERKYDARKQRPTESDGKFSKSGEKRGKIDEPQKERYRSEKTENERKYDARKQRPTEGDGKFSKSGEKRGKTDEPQRERYRGGKTENERKYDTRRQRPTEGDGKFSKSGEKRGKIDEPQRERYRSGKTEDERKYDTRRQRPTEGDGKFSKSGEKRRKIDEPQKERYRSGKMKEERPSHKSKTADSTRAPEREAKWYDDATKPRRPKSKKAAASGAKKTSMTGAVRRSKLTSKPKAKKSR